MNYKNCFFIAFTFVALNLEAQRDSIYDQGQYRTFIIHLPSGYSTAEKYPLVINMHGLGSNAFEQELYTQFDLVADDQKMIVVYPDAINNSWDLFGNIDLNFLTRLVDTLRDRYSTNNCLFFMGMSQGGFMSYKLACEFPYPIAAIAVVTGNMTVPLQSSCMLDVAMPVMHFHGTADQVVMYNGSFGIPPVEETIQWCVQHNMCSQTPVVTSLPDINHDDESTAEEQRYSECDANGDVIFYKIINGGHTWPGAFPIPTLGNTNQDIDASALIGQFFSDHCSTTTATHHFQEYSIAVYPNPVDHDMIIETAYPTFDIVLFDLKGIAVLSQKNLRDGTTVHLPSLISGLYILKISGYNRLPVFVKVIINQE